MEGGGVERGMSVVAVSAAAVPVDPATRRRSRHAWFLWFALRWVAPCTVVAISVAGWQPVEAPEIGRGEAIAFFAVAALIVEALFALAVRVGARIFQGAEIEPRRLRFVALAALLAFAPWLLGTIDCLRVESVLLWPPLVGQFVLAPLLGALALRADPSRRGTFARWIGRGVGVAPALVVALLVGRALWFEPRYAELERSLDSVRGIVVEAGAGIADAPDFLGGRPNGWMTPFRGMHWTGTLRTEMGQLAIEWQWRWDFDADRPRLAIGGRDRASAEALAARLRELVAPRDWIVRVDPEVAPK